MEAVNTFLKHVTMESEFKTTTMVVCSGKISCLGAKQNGR